MTQDCIFCKIVNGTIPAQRVYQSETVVAFRDIRPQAPVHILIIPRQHVAMVSDLQRSDDALVGEMIAAANQIAREEGISAEGFRLVFNCGRNAGQDVFHLHLHLLGGRPFDWPPG